MDDPDEQEGIDAQRFLEWAAPGHFYSPVPDHVEIERQASRIFEPQDELPASISIRTKQVRHFLALSRLAREVGLPAHPDPHRRYHAENLNYGIGDALMLSGFLRHLRPRRYLEVGSGWTTALALDVNEHWLSDSMQITAIEPYPELLRSLLRPADAVRIIPPPSVTSRCRCSPSSRPTTCCSSTTPTW